MYKTVKICKKCFIIYSLLSKYFDKKLSKSLKSKVWKPQTASHKQSRI